LKLNYDELLSNIAFNRNLRHYSKDRGEIALDAAAGASGRAVQVDSIKTCVESAFGFSA